MAKKTVKEIVTILKADIEQNTILLGEKHSPLSIACAHGLASRFKIGNAVINDPYETNSLNPKALRVLVTQLFKSRVDYTDIKETMDNISFDDSNGKELQGGINFPLVSGILSRLIGYDLFMLTAMAGVYPSQVSGLNELWEKQSKGNLNICRKIINVYNGLPNMERTLHGGNGPEDFSLPLFCVKK